MRRLLIALIGFAGLAAQQDRNAAAWIGEGSKLEDLGRRNAKTINQLAIEVAKADAQLQEMDRRRKELEVDNGASEDTKDRAAKAIKELDAQRKPIETGRARTERERTRLIELRELERALDAFRKGVDKASADSDKALLAKALHGVARVCEIIVPENVTEAQAAYARIVADCPGQEPILAEAKRKLALRGVDVYLEQFAQFVTEWRDVVRNSPGALEEKRRELTAKIRAIGKDAMDGLIDGLGHKDEVVRTFASVLLPTAADENGIAALIRLLGEGSSFARAGAGQAIARIFETWSAARSLDREGDRILEDLDAKDPEDPAAQRMSAENRERAKENKRRAAEMRGFIPENLGSRPEIGAALHKLLSDEKAAVGARIEAAKALRSIGEYSGPLVDAVHRGLSSRDRSVREACCLAASGVDTKDSPAKHKLADRLMEIVRYEPDADSRPQAERDVANDAGVRVAAAEALGVIGVVKASPALIEALSDADGAVRRGAHEALKRITGLDLGYESDPLIPGSTGRTVDEIFKAQVAKRHEGITRWTKWWTDTRGTDVTVARFWNFQARFKGGDPFQVYEREVYLRDLANRTFTMKDPAAELERGRRTCDRFKAGKDLLLRDATDLGPESIDKYLPRLSGAVAQDERLSGELQARSRATVRFFVAETVGKLIELARASEKPALLREQMSAGGTKEMKAGAALALGYLPRDLSGPDDLAALASRGLEDADPEVREAASRSLGRIGTADQGPALAKVASLQVPGRAGEAAQLAALRALAALAPKNEDVIRTCGELVGDESSKRSISSAVREAACDVLGAVKDPSALTNLWLYRGRRDIARGVREAATRAIAAIAAADPATPDEIAKIVASASARSIDRQGAALALGDLAEPRTVPTLVWQIVDRNPPMALKAADATVRAMCAEALGAMGPKARYALVGEKLVEGLGDSAELVRVAALEALTKIAPSPPDADAFKVRDPEAARAAGVARMKAWFENNRAQWKELAQ